VHPSFDRGAVQTAGRERLTRIGRIKMESVLDEWSAGLELIRSFSSLRSIQQRVVRRPRARREGTGHRDERRGSRLV